MIVTLIRFALAAPSSDAGTEPTPPIGLAYLAGMCKDADIDIDVKGIDAAGTNLNKIFKIPKYNPCSKTSFRKGNAICLQRSKSKKKRV